LEFIGRRDNQVKIRGYRVELGEIEAAAVREEWVDQAAVVAVDTGQRGKQIVGFYVERRPPGDGEELGAKSERELSKKLSERMPEYMRAARWQRVERLPLTVNGKVDRRELEQRATKLLQEGLERDAAAEKQGAATAIEEIVAGIWEEVLGVSEVGVEDNFFEIGGHSLLATQVVTRIREALGVDVAVREVFEGATVREICQKLEEGLGQDERYERKEITRVSRDNPLPLSFAQERFRFLEMFQPGTSVYHMPVAVRLTGNLNVPALEKSLNEVRRRHEVLRTRFVDEAGAGVQIIDQAEDESLSVCDLEQVADDQREDEVKKLIRQQADRAFDLAQGRLMRNSVLRVSSIEHVLVVVMHHIVSDGWSMGVMIREVSECYSRYERGEESGLAELEIQYGDYAAWQRENVSAERESEELEYWASQLEGQENVELATDRVRPAVQSYSGGRERMEVREELTAELKRLSRQSGATLFMTLLAAFKILLYRYSDHEDITVGTLIAGRNRIETEGLIGLFINAIALRTDLSGDPTFAELLKRVREGTLAAYAHQDLPFEKLVDHLHVERDMSRSPLFQIMFLFQNAPLSPLELPGITLTPLEYYSGAVAYDLMISISEQGRTLNIKLEYSKDLFNDGTIKRMLKHYGALLESIVAAPAGHISDLPLLEEVERKQLLLDWNDALCPYPLHESFTRLFEIQVESTPDSIAVAAEGRSLTYRELDQQANKLAGLLVNFGVEPESIVALYARRSIEFLTGMLAVFKAGGSYLPLDPAYPSSRISTIIEQAQCGAVLASVEFQDNLMRALETMPSETQPAVYLIEELMDRESGDDNLPQKTTPNSLAYVIFTSGSTGMPKGAMVEQAGMLNHLYAKISALGLSAADVIAQTASQCFDISVWQFLAPLLVGGRVEIMNDDVVHDPARLLDQVEEQGITVLEVVPALLRAIVDEANRSNGRHKELTALRWLLSTGEPLAPDLARQWVNSYPQIPLLNAYGPTECSDDVAHYRIESPPPEDVAQVPVGRPIPNMELYVLDRMMQPVPAGIPGELCVGGVGVGRGYVNDPVKTAESFVPSPFARQPGARLYKTGDLVRYLHDGNIEHRGRMDQQVKIRGFRIETGEVEAALCLHPEVREALVMARMDSTGNKHLVAYLVPDQTGLPTDETSSSDELAVMTADEIVAALTPRLQIFLKERLPEYTVPAFLIGLESFPLTRNGKIDHNALGRMSAPISNLEQVIVAPKTATEERLAEIWKQVLELSRVSVRDRFLDIGGDSLRIIRAYRALSELYPDKLTVADLFKYNTIESLGTFIDETSVLKQSVAAGIQGYEL
jgi:amino acid adenylation domain-containing protein